MSSLFSSLVLEGTQDAGLFETNYKGLQQRSVCQSLQGIVWAKGNVLKQTSNKNVLKCYCYPIWNC